MGTNESGIAHRLAWHERGAYLIDAYRVVPRILVFGYSALVWKAASWFMSLPDPAAEQSAFVTLLAGFLVPLTNWYMQNGVDWDKRLRGGDGGGATG